MGSIYRRKGSPFYWISYYQVRLQKRESSGSDKITKAKELLRKREGAIADGKPVNPKRRKDQGQRTDRADPADSYSYRALGEQIFEWFQSQGGGLPGNPGGKGLLDVRATAIRHREQRGIQRVDGRAHRSRLRPVPGEDALGCAEEPMPSPGDDAEGHQVGRKRMATPVPCT